MGNNKTWEYKEHFHAIGMTGDYSGHYEVTNGDISLCTNDDPEDITETENTLQKVARVLNESDCKFYCDTTTEHKLHIENMELRYKMDDLKDQAQRMADALGAISDHIKECQNKKIHVNEMAIALTIAQALQQFKDGNGKEVVEEPKPEGWPWVCEYCGKQDCGSDHK